MAVTIPSMRTWAVNDPLTAALMNAQLRDLGNLVLNRPYAKLYPTATQPIANNTATMLTFDQETEDADGMHNPASNTSRLTIQTPGLYVFNGTVTFPNTQNGTGYRNLTVVKNGVTVLGRNQGMSVETSQTCSTFVETRDRANIGDYYELQVLQNSGGSLSTVAALADTWFSALWERV